MVNLFPSTITYKTIPTKPFTQNNETLACSRVIITHCGCRSTVSLLTFHAHGWVIKVRLWTVFSGHHDHNKTAWPKMTQGSGPIELLTFDLLYLKALIFLLCNSNKSQEQYCLSFATRRRTKTFEHVSSVYWSSVVGVVVKVSSVRWQNQE